MCVIVHSRGANVVGRNTTNDVLEMTGRNVTGMRPARDRESRTVKETMTTYRIRRPRLPGPEHCLLPRREGHC